MGIARKASGERKPSQFWSKTLIENEVTACDRELTKMVSLLSVALLLANAST